MQKHLNTEIDGVIIDITIEQNHEKLRKINLHNQELLIREVIKKQLDGKKLDVNGKSIDSKLPFFSDNSCLRAYEKEFNATMQQCNNNLYLLWNIIKFLEKKL